MSVQFGIDNTSQCNGCNPYLDCGYFDGRYAVLTQEDGYGRIIVDADIAFLVDYNEEEKGKLILKLFDGFIEKWGNNL